MNTRIVGTAWAAAACALGCAATTKPLQKADASSAIEAFPTARPPPLDRAEVFRAPLPSAHKLTNGLSVLIVENHALPLVAAELLVFAGVDAVAPKEAGLAGATARMLTEGTQRRTAAELSERLEDLAIEVGTDAGADHMSVSMDALTETLPDALSLFAEVVVEPGFRTDDFSRVQKLLLTALEQKRGSPESLASDVFVGKVFGIEHPLGQPAGGSLETVKRLTPSALSRFHRRWFHPENAVLVIAGDVTPEGVLPLLETSFSKWRPHKLTRHKTPAPKLKSVRSLVLLDQAHATQSYVMWGGLGLPASHPDALALRLSNLALGGLFSSRLNSNLREAKGYSYGFFSRTNFERDVGTWHASGPIKAADTPAALEEIRGELARFAEHGPTEAELAQAKLALVRGLPAALETNGAVAAAISRLVLLGLPLDYYAKLGEQTAALSRDAVTAATQRHLRPNTWPIVIAGPKASVEAGVKALGLGELEVLSAP
ncbi:MAG: M16 family metallopeptidase [Myxococcaceae bacterium]